MAFVTHRCALCLTIFSTGGTNSDCFQILRSCTSLF